MQYIIGTIKEVYFDKSEYSIIPWLDEGKAFLASSSQVLSSYLSTTISILTLIMGLFIFIAEEWLNMANILAFSFDIEYTVAYIAPVGMIKAKLAEIIKNYILGFIKAKLSEKIKSIIQSLLSILLKELLQAVISKPILGLALLCLIAGIYLDLYTNNYRGVIMILCIYIDILINYTPYNLVFLCLFLWEEESSSHILLNLLRFLCLQ